MTEHDDEPSVMGAGAGISPMPTRADAEAAWLDRYKQRFIERADLTETQARACAAAETFAVLSEGFEDDPEGAADEEMSYWEPD